MRRTAGLLAATVLLGGCTTSVLETWRPSSDRKLWGERTLVVADLDEEYRGAVEDAIARRLPGAVSASALPVDEHAGSVWSSLFAGAADDSVSVWDTLVTLQVAHGQRRLRTREGDVIADPEDGYERIDFRVSVLRTADRAEVFGVTIRSSPGGAALGTFEDLSRCAATCAGRELAATGLFR